MSRLSRVSTATFPAPLTASPLVKREMSLKRMSKAITRRRPEPSPKGMEAVIPGSPVLKKVYGSDQKTRRVSPGCTS